jgi:hypothetical protein
VIIFVLFLGYDSVFKENKEMDSFYKSKIDSKLRQDMIKKNIWSKKCPVSLDRLNILRVSYVDFDGIEHHDGSIIVLDVVADHVLSIFKELFDKKFPISSINLINQYDGNDEKSMEDNNTVAFNCRNIANSNFLSMHSYGLAIDINPQQNPYLVTKYDTGKVSIPVYPPLGMVYLNRKNIRAGMVETVLDNQETVIDIFYKHGFTIWGGGWNDPVDWHHFQLTVDQAESIINLPYAQALEFFNKIASAKARIDGSLASNNIKDKSYD